MAPMCRDTIYIVVCIALFVLEMHWAFKKPNTRTHTQNELPNSQNEMQIECVEESQ